MDWIRCTIIKHNKQNIFSFQIKIFFEFKNKACSYFNQGFAIVKQRAGRVEHYIS